MGLTARSISFISALFTRGDTSCELFKGVGFSNAVVLEHPQADAERMPNIEVWKRFIVDEPSKFLPRKPFRINRHFPLSLCSQSRFAIVVSIQRFASVLSRKSAE